MSGVQSTYDGAVTYMMGKNALPRNFIADGMKMTPVGLSLDISAGCCDINGARYENDVTNQSLPAMSTGLVYAQAVENSLCPSIGYVSGRIPLDFIDNNTVGFWIFNKTGALSNRAVGISSVAVANDVVSSGGFTQIEGAFDYTLKGDGTSGKFQASNITNIPVGNSEREVIIGYTHFSSSSPQFLVSWGAQSSNAAFSVCVDVSNMLTVDFWGAGNSINTGYQLYPGYEYVISVGYDGKFVRVIVDGVLIAMSPYSTNTGNSFLTFYASSAYCSGALHFVEIRNKMRSRYQNAKISNIYVHPVSYTAHSINYPPLPSGSHEWRFNDAGTTISDTNTASPVNGVATGTAVVSGEMPGRKFSGTDYITTDPIAVPNNFTFAATFTPNALNTWNNLFDNRNASSLDGMCFTINSNGQLAVSNGSSVIYSNACISPFQPSTVIVTSYNGQLSMYVNSYNVDIATTLTTSTTSRAASIGRDCSGASTTYFSGIMHHMTLIPQAYSKAEVRNLFNTVLNKTKRNIFTDLVPTNSIVVGMYRTGYNKVTDYDDYLHKYGRREKATGGNRRIFLGYQYYNTLGTSPVNVRWDNPFATRKVRTTIVWSAECYGAVEFPVFSYFETGSPAIAYGTLNAGRNNGSLGALIAAKGASFVNGTWMSSGYIGCYAEIMEDD